MFGSLRELEHGAELRFVRRLAHPQEKVWRALTEPENFAAWFPARMEGDHAPGAALRFIFEGDEANPIPGEMLAYEPPSVLEFRWENDVLRFELAPDGEDRCTLTLVNTIEQLGKAARDGAGWHACLDVLEAQLAGQSYEWAGERWGEVHPRYVETFGPAASTIGPPASHNEG